MTQCGTVGHEGTQFGLYLASEKAPVKVVVIDHIERATRN